MVGLGGGVGSRSDHIHTCICMTFQRINIHACICMIFLLFIMAFSKNT